MEWYQKSAEDALKELNTDAESGLSEVTAKERLEQYGENALPVKHESRLKMILPEQCTDILLVGLLVAMFCALAGRHYAATVLFLLSAVARVVPSIQQSLRSGRDAESMESFVFPQTRVFREGHTENIPTAEVVPGDIVVLEAGDMIPADLRLIEGYSLQIDESMIFSGAGVVDKNAKAVWKDTVEKTEQSNMAFAGSAVIGGRGRGLVTATGKDSQLAHIARLLHKTSKEKPGTRLGIIGQEIGLLCVAGWLILFLMDLIYGETVHYLNHLSNFAAAVIPCGLALSSWEAIAFTLKRFKVNGVRVNSLSAAERLSNVNVICTDKTGTLTENEMTATLLWTGNRFTVVDATGYAPEGEFRSADGEVIDPWERKDLIKLLSASALCNNAALEESEANIWVAQGNPMEAALLALTEKAGIRKSAMESAFPRIGEIPFDAERQRMTTVHRTNHYPIAYVKGSPEEILSRCMYYDLGQNVTDMTIKLRQRILKIGEAMAKKSLNVIAVAYRDLAAMPTENQPEELENELTFLGLIGLIDPVRSDTPDAVRESRAAQIRTILMTGESANNAAIVAKTAGILTEKDEERVLTGAEWEKLTEAERDDAVMEVSVFAEIVSSQKKEILEALHRKGAVAAVTGSSAEDVPVLHAADIGAAKGKSGTEIAGTAAQVVLEDDGYAGLVKAVWISRVLFANLRGILRYLLSAAVSVGLLLLGAAILHKPLSFPTTGLLLCNLVLFTLPAVAIGHQGEEQGIMTEAPRRSEDNLIDRPVVCEIVVRALIQTVLCGIFYWISAKSRYAISTENPELYASSAVYTLFVLSTLLSAFSCRWARMPLWESGDSRDFLILMGTVAFGSILHLVIMGVESLRNLFALPSITTGTFLWLLAFAVVIVLLGEACKLYVLPKFFKQCPRLKIASNVRLKRLPDLSERLKKIQWKRFSPKRISPLDWIRFSDDGEENDDDEYDLKYGGKKTAVQEEEAVEEEALEEEASEESEEADPEEELAEDAEEAEDSKEEDGEVEIEEIEFEDGFEKFSLEDGEEVEEEAEDEESEAEEDEDAAAELDEDGEEELDEILQTEENADGLQLMEEYIETEDFDGEDPETEA